MGRGRMGRHTVLYHDDFDGMASAVLLTVLLRSHGRPDPAAYVPVNYGMPGLDWHTDAPMAVGGPLAVVDFMYHPQADYWFDHHPTAFRTLGAVDAFAAVRAAAPMQFGWDAEYPSCAALLLSRLEPDARFPWAALATAATMIDTAGYPSPEYYYEAVDRAAWLGQAWWDLSTDQKTRIIQLLLAYGAVEGIDAAYERFMDVINTSRNQLRAALVDARAHARLQGPLVVLDLVGTGIPMPRFAGFIYHPEAQYQATITSSGPLVRLSVGKNAWRGERLLHLGNAMMAIGGGGHEDAAGAEFTGPDAHAQAVRFVAGLANAMRASTTSARPAA